MNRDLPPPPDESWRDHPRLGTNYVRPSPDGRAAVSWDGLPDGLKTRTQWRAAGFRPRRGARPYARYHSAQVGDVALYSSSDVVPRRSATAKQLAVLEYGRELAEIAADLEVCRPRAEDCADLAAYSSRLPPGFPCHLEMWELSYPERAQVLALMLEDWRDAGDQRREDARRRMIARLAAEEPSPERGLS